MYLASLPQDSLKMKRHSTGGKGRQGGQTPVDFIVGGEPSRADPDGPLREGADRPVRLGGTVQSDAHADVEIGVEPEADGRRVETVNRERQGAAMPGRICWPY